MELMGMEEDPCFDSWELGSENLKILICWNGFFFDGNWALCRSCNVEMGFYSEVFCLVVLTSNVSLDCSEVD